MKRARDVYDLFELDGIIRSDNLSRELPYMRGKPLPIPTRSHGATVAMLDTLATQPDPRFLTLRSKGTDHERHTRVRR